MKKILLSVALVAMSVFSMSALSIKLEVNDVEVKNGDVIEITTLDNVLWGIEGMGQSMAPHMKMTNEGSAVDVQVVGVFEELAMPETTTGQPGSMSQFCFGSCFMVESKVGAETIIPLSLEAGQVLEGNAAHVEYVPAYEGTGYLDIQSFYKGVSVFKFTVRNASDSSDAISFTFKFNYKGNDAIDGIEADNAAAEYYNLQGVKVANPEKGGMYIVRRGAKVSKEIVR